MHGSALPTSRVVEHCSLGVPCDCGAVGVRRDNMHISDDASCGKHVTEHREGELPPSAPRGMQPRLAVDSRKRNDDRRHMRRLARWVKLLYSEL